MATGVGYSFNHEALLYEGRADFFRQTLSFIREAVAALQPILVAVDQPKIDGLRDALGTDAAAVRFEDMERIGRNPARIIPVWQGFVAEHEGNSTGARGVGEPIWAGRTSDELVECERHEALLNLAFASPVASLRLICPYDTEALPAAVVEEARRNHPVVREEGAARRSRTYRDLDVISRPFDAPLPRPNEAPAEMQFDEDHLFDLRTFVRAQAWERNLAPSRIPDLVLAVHETVTNSIRYGGGERILQVWSQDGKVICEVSDNGVIDQPLAGRLVPDPTEPGGFGLWLANQLCDLVQIRTSEQGSVVRLHIGPA